MRYGTILLALLLLSRAAFAQELTIPARVRAAAQRITAEQLKRDLHYLSSDALRGRDTPSPGFDSAAAYIARRLSRAGVKPLGDAGTYFQHYTLRETVVDTAEAYLEIAGRRFRFGTDFLVRTYPRPVTATTTLVYVGHGMRVPARGIDPYAGLDVRGKLLLAHGPSALPVGLSSDLLGRRDLDYFTPWAEAHRRGAVGVLFLPPSQQLGQWERLRSRGRSSFELEPPVPSAYAAIPTPSIAVKPHVLDALLAERGVTGNELVARGDSSRYLASFELPEAVTLHLPASTNLEHRPYNVVAFVEGSDPVLKQEFVTIASHLDGAVGRAVVDGDSVYNAADDNATGSAGTLAIAEALARSPRPRRSILFLWDSGEERGLWGTRRFVGKPVVPLDRIVAHINVDMIGGAKRPGTNVPGEEDLTGPDEVHLIGPRVLSAELDSLLERANRSYLQLRLNRTYDTVASEFFYPRTDAGPFLERGVPTIGFFTGLHPRYHAPADEARYLDPQKMTAITRTVFVSVWLLANAPDRPRLDKGIPDAVPRYR